MQISNKIMQITNKLQQSKCKEIRERESNTRFLRDSTNSAYVRASKLIGVEHSTIQALYPKASKIFTIDFKGVNQPLQSEIIPNLLT